ncbi:MAG: carbohydrate ABC transporter substrate-binding protein [Treponema sp.]|nr:carbohydrate ABC transporter substrate-binding protein [Treponema sp.]
MLGAIDGCSVYLNSNPIEIYKFDTKDAVGKKILQNINSTNTIELLGTKFPAIVNEPFVIINYNSHPDRDKIVKSFKRFPDSTIEKTSNVSSSGNNGLQVWSFTDEIEGFLNAESYGYKATHPNIEVEYTMIPTDWFPGKLDPVLATGKGAPDVFSLEDAFVRKYVESGLLLPLDDLYEEVKNKMADYPMKVGSYNGHVYAMSWNVCPGAMFYRRSYARKYWGTDNPVEVQEKVKDLNAFVATARELNRVSNGKCKMVSTYQDLFNPYKGARNKPWVVDDRLYIDPAMEKYMEMAKIFYDEELDGRTSQWAEGWYAGMNDRLRDEKGNDLEVMCYFLPTWGLHYILKQDASKTSGDWAMCAGPAPYRWGGTWIAAYKGTKKPEAAKEMIRYLATDDKFLETMAKATGDVIGNYNVQNKIKDNFSEPYLGGQNHYAQFCEMAKTVDGSLIQGTDQQIEAIFTEVVTDYVKGRKTKRVALYDFKKQVETQMGL